ncbi:MAG: NAD-dependent epimerase/dehydratase family protein [Candidatus Aenigmatarchaeota archaeon]
MKALVTGGAGFIGSHLAEKLADLGHEVSILDNLSITDRNLPPLREKGIGLIIADITDLDRMLTEIKGFDTVFHLAAMNRAIKSINDPIKANRVNIDGTLNVLEACRKNGAGKVIFTSSSSVYGDSKIFPRREENGLIPSHPYAVGKLAAEQYMKVYHSLYGLKTVILRYFSVYGPRQLGTIEHAGVIPKFIHRVYNGEEIEVYGDGNATRSFTYVEDVVNATIKASKTEAAVGETINISSEREISVNGLISLIEGALGKKANVRHVGAVKGEVRANMADSSKAKRLLGFSEKTPIEEGVKKTVSWYKEEFLGGK